MATRFGAASVIAFTLATTAGGAFAGPEAENNFVGLTISGLENTLVIEQTYTAGTVTAPNSIQVDIVGDNNGGGAAWPSGALIETGLTPGSLFQSGAGNDIAISVTGHGNLFAVRQVGYANSVAGQITGTGNAAAITQGGTGNHVSFSQTGQNNTIVVSQSTH
ncbi:hypothetical protein [Pseudooceanicola nanhaiensis]|uniref:hypothetical protein n=1 Tax=Pseudooceanicola nanhaiensis TaxID=375761 RepID=UPI001CD31AA3|nr:hypothetical protein [Pseudooceanicola nanhaiensis]MCA0922087.1 hypothetical protein [Pseudooceanicola nanhaiensis]